jgi:hypothetical protein
MEQSAYPSSPRWLPRRLRRYFGSFSFLLIALVALLLLHPLLAESTLERESIGAGFTLIFLAGLYAVKGERRTLITGLALVIPAIAGSWVSLFFESPLLYAVSRALEAVFLLYVTGIILRHVMTEDDITNDTVYGAACAYLLIGLVFAVVYSWLEFTQPGSFSGITVGGAGGTTQQPIWQFTYFSLVTITTLGYGDITPLSGTSRSLATLEALAGQFYVAVLVARIVAILTYKRMRS